MSATRLPKMFCKLKGIPSWFVTNSKILNVRLDTLKPQSGNPIVDSVYPYTLCVNIRYKKFEDMKSDVQEIEDKMRSTY